MTLGKIHKGPRVRFSNPISEHFGRLGRVIQRGHSGDLQVAVVKFFPTQDDPDFSTTGTFDLTALEILGQEEAA